MPGIFLEILLNNSRFSKKKFFFFKNDEFKAEKESASLIIIFFIFFYVFNFSNLSIFVIPRRIIFVIRETKYFFYLNSLCFLKIIFNIIVLTAAFFFSRRLRFLFVLLRSDFEKGSILYFFDYFR